MAENKDDETSAFLCRVIRGHQASFPTGLLFTAGDVLSVEDRETSWEGWVWCVDGQGTGAWVPEAFVRRQGGSCVALRDYDSMELTVAVGDVLQAHEEAAGWLWCTDAGGRRGWVPGSCVEPQGPL